MITDFRLNVFVTVARCLSFTRAAALLNISQPAISKHIKELESDFGEALFNRQGNRISPTEKAYEILPIIESILERYTTLNDTISIKKGGFEGTLRIGASTTIAQYMLPDLLAQFNKAYPKINLSLISANSDDIIKLLKQKEIDLAMIEGDSSSNQVHYRHFASDKIVLVSSHAKKTHKLSLQQITNIPLIIREEGSGTLSVILNSLLSRGVSRKNLNIKMQLGSSEAIIRYLRASNSYAFLSILVAKDHIERGEMAIHRVDDLEIVREFRYATLHGYSSRLVNLFQSFCDKKLLTKNRESYPALFKGRLINE